MTTFSFSLHQKIVDPLSGLIRSILVLMDVFSEVLLGFGEESDVEKDIVGIGEAPFLFRLLHQQQRTTLQMVSILTEKRN